MMKIVRKILTGILLGSILVSFTKFPLDSSPKEKENDPRKELANFPEASTGMVRHVILLDKKTNENLYKVEIIPGKVMKVDCNKHTLMGKTEEKELEGWGYTYFEFSSDGETLSTRMACPNSNDVEKFVSSQSTNVSYNSKLPIVIYAPKGYTIKYRIWEASKEKNASEK